MANVEPTIYTANGVTYSGGGSNNYFVKASNGDLYVFVTGLFSGLFFKKSSDGGFTWSAPTTIYSGAVLAFAVWYDRWSDLGTDYISVAYTETSTDDTRFRTINTGSSDALSTETVIFAGTDTAGGSWLSLTRTRGGNVLCYTVIDAGSEGGFFKLATGDFPNGSWSSALTNLEALATNEGVILLPGWAVDNQDAMMFFWDNTANEISRCLYDDSANTWGETSIATSMTKLTHSNGFPSFAAAVDITNSRNLLVAWSATDTSNADLRCFHVTESAITEVTEVVLNSGGNQALCGISIDTDTEDWYVFYAGKSDGTEEWAGGGTINANIYYKKSTDDGTTWGAETLLTSGTTSIKWLAVIPRVDTDDLLKVLFGDAFTTPELRISLPLPTGGGEVGYGFCG